MSYYLKLYPFCPFYEDFRSTVGILTNPTIFQLMTLLLLQHSYHYTTITIHIEDNITFIF